MEPSIKGFAVAPTLKKLDELGFNRGETRVRWAGLSGDAIALLQTPPSPMFWYPVRAQGELLDRLARELGGGEEAIVAFAHDSAAEVLAAPALRVLMQGASKLGGRRLGHTLVKMARFGFNFGSWRFEGEDLSEFRVLAEGVEALPESVRFNLQGFVEHLASRLSDAKVVCHSRHGSPGKLIFEASTPGA